MHTLIIHPLVADARQFDETAKNKAVVDGLSGVSRKRGINKQPPAPLSHIRSIQQATEWEPKPLISRTRRRTDVSECLESFGSAQD